MSKSYDLDYSKMPVHIALIMDGNGRWAKKRGLPRTMGHRAGIKSLRIVIDEAVRLGIKIVSLYAFSTENWKRPQQEINEIFNLLREFVNEDVDKFIKQDTKIITMGDLSKLPEDIQRAIQNAVEKTKNCKTHIFNLGINYGGRPEIIRAVNNIINSGIKNVDEQTFKKYLYTADLPDPDFVVRTSGEMRLSNFMPYQTTYSEFYFPTTYWPDFKAKELQKAIYEYQQRSRRFGGLEK